MTAAAETFAELTGGHVVGGNPAAVQAANAMMAEVSSFRTPEVNAQPVVGQFTNMVQERGQGTGFELG